MAWTNPRTWVAGEIVTAALLNTHLRDNLNAVSGIWQAYTPSLVNWTGGSNTTSGRYTQIGKTVHFRARVVLGTGFGVSGTPGLSLPVTASAGNFGPPNMTAVLVDSGTTTFLAFASIAASVRAEFFYQGTNGAVNVVSATAPFTWVVGDSLEVSGTYEAA